MRRQLAVLVMWTAVFLLAGAMRAGAQLDTPRLVKGTIRVPSKVSVRDVVVYLEGALGTPAPAKAVIDQKDNTFVPFVVAVPVGGTVEFLNSDPVMHNVLSTSKPKHFDLGMFRKGEIRTVTFDKPGVVELRCNVHSSMRAFVMVLENSFFTRPDEQGAFEISGIPAGRYKLHAWHPDLKPIEAVVNLDEAKQWHVDLGFGK